jgi:hypothetical protein
MSDQLVARNQKETGKKQNSAGYLLGNEAKPSASASGGVKNVRRYIYTPPHIFIKHRDSVTLPEVGSIQGC